MIEEKFKVKYGGSSVDISTFLRNHPGGVNTLEKYEGLDIDEKFKFYEHSKAAEYLIKDFKSRNQKVEDESYLEVK
jgi:cytochrome b involved in lipid metabolism